MKIKLLFTLLAAIVLCACGNAQASTPQAPAATATREPDRIGEPGIGIVRRHLRHRDGALGERL